MAETLVLSRRYVDIAWLWVRAAWVYRTSFLTLVVANGLITGLDAVAIWITFTTSTGSAGSSCTRSHCSTALRRSASGSRTP